MGIKTLLLVLAATMAWNLLSPHADARLEAIRQKGYPVTLSELNEWYRAVPTRAPALLSRTTCTLMMIPQQLRPPGIPPGLLQLCGLAYSTAFPKRTRT